LVLFVGQSYVDFRASISAEAIAMSNDTAAYVAGWLKKLRDDRRLRRQAAAQGRHAADYILRAPPTV
jgi:antirestriction protein ArdC